MGKIYDGIMGLVVGDAVGVPYEFKQRDTFVCGDMTGYGTYSQPKGTWSDDSSMALATLDSIVKKQRIDPSHIMSRFASWLNDSLYTPYGETFDVGNMTRRALDRYMSGSRLQECGGRGGRDNGNGSLMRILPLAFVRYSSLEKQVEYVNRVGTLTHAHEISKTACQVYVCIAKELINGKFSNEACIQSGIETAKKIYPDGRWDSYERLSRISELSRDEIKSTGFVVDTLEAALWCITQTDNYRDCVLCAVNLGDDTDTTASVAGGLAGIIYGSGGESGIPEEWIASVAKQRWITDLCRSAERQTIKA